GRYYIDGNPLPQSPKWVHNLTARWGVPVGQGELFVFTDWAYRSEVNFFLYESPEFTGKSSLEGGLRLGYNWADGNREVAVCGRGPGAARALPRRAAPPPPRAGEGGVGAAGQRCDPGVAPPPGLPPQAGGGAAGSAGTMHSPARFRVST